MRKMIIRFMMLDDRSIAKWGMTHCKISLLMAALFLAVSVWIPVHFRIENAPFQKRLTSACAKLVQFENSKNIESNSQVVATAETIAIHRVNAFILKVPMIAAIFVFSLAIAFGMIGTMYLRLQQLLNHSQPSDAPAATTGS